MKILLLHIFKNVVIHFAIDVLIKIIECVLFVIQNKNIFKINNFSIILKIKSFIVNHVKMIFLIISKLFMIIQNFCVINVIIIIRIEIIEL